MKEYRENPQAADEKYLGKMLMVSGEINGILKDLDYGWISIRGRGNFSSSDPNPLGIGCIFDSPEKELMDKFDTSQRVTIVGKNDGMQKAKKLRDGKFVTLINCRFEETPYVDESPTEENLNLNSNTSTTQTIPSEIPLPDASNGKLPTDEEIQALLEKTLRDLTNAIETEDFTAFQTTLSKGSVSRRVTPERLKMFYGNKMFLPQLRGIIGTKPTFTRTPFVGEYTLTKADKTVEVYQALNLIGYFENAQSSVTFNVQYLAEGKDWKVSIFNFSSTQRSKNEIKLSGSEWEIVLGKNYGRFQKSHQQFTVKSNGEISCSDTENECSGNGKITVGQVNDIDKMLKTIDLPSAKGIGSNNYNSCIVSMHLPNVYFTLTQNGRSYGLKHCHTTPAKKEFRYTVVLSESRSQTYEDLRKNIVLLFVEMREPIS